MKVVIMRGIPGAGKSTWIKQNFFFHIASEPAPVVCSADDYHMVDGEYRFDPANIGKAHDACLRKFLDHLTWPVKPAALIVDNTNTRTWEAAPYVRLAELHGVDVEVVTIFCEPMTAWQRNTHAVPLVRVLEMYRNLLLDPLPPHWKHQAVVGG